MHRVKQCIFIKLLQGCLHFKKICFKNLYNFCWLTLAQGKSEEFINPRFKAKSADCRHNLRPGMGAVIGHMQQELPER